MKRLMNVLYILLVLSSSLYSLNYSENFPDERFFDSSFDKIVRYEPLNEKEIFSDINTSKNLQNIISQIKEELSNPHSKVQVSVVGYSGHKSSKKQSLEDSKLYADTIYKKLIQSDIDKEIIYKDAQADKSMLYTDFSVDSNALSNRVSINLYVNYFKDEDNDGIYEDKDKCPYTKNREIVNEDGCSAKNIVILIEGNKKNSKIIVSNDAGNVTVEHFNQLTILGSKDTPPTKPQNISQEKINANFPFMQSIEMVSKHYVLYFDGLNLDTNSKNILTSVLEELKTFNNPVIKLIGHTDTVGSSNYNYKLGLKRAKEIQKIILDSKIRYLNMEVVSYGESNLVVKTEDNVSEKENKRVELFIH